MSPHPRPRTYLIPLDDPQRAWDDPGLAAIAAQGWTVAGHDRVIAAGSERPQMLMFMWPPAAPARSRVFGVGVAVGVAVGTVLALICAIVLGG